MNAELIHTSRRGWDSESDRITLEAAKEQGDVFSIYDLFSRTRIDEGRTLRSAIRLIGDGDITLSKLVPITEAALCKVAA